MLNRIIRFSLLNRMIVLVLTALIIVAGCIVLTRAEVDIFPDLNAPTVVVMTEAPGLAPEEVEKQVTYPVETAMTGSNGVRRTRSSSSTGFSVVWIEFDWGTDIYRARQTVAERLATIGESLPAGVGTPVMGPQSSILGEVMIIGFTPDSTSILDVRNVIDRQVRRQLLATPGVAQVSVLGGEEREMQVLLSPEKMKFHNVTLAEVLEALDGSNDNATGSILYAHGNEYIVKGAVNSATPADIANLSIPNSNGKLIRLADIARVEFGGKTPRLGAASVEGKESVILTITKQPETGTIELTEELDQRLADMKNVLPADVTVHANIFRQSEFISNSINNLQTSLLEGALMVVIVLFFFLMNFRTTMISLVALPLSIIITVIILWAMGVTINTMTLGGIAIAIGSLVDDAIVDVENVYKRLRHNHELPKEQRRTKLQVVYEASKEVRQPIFNSSLIVIASFLPLFFLSGMEGRMLIPLGIAFIVSLAASTIVALTLTPVLCSYLLGNTPEDKTEKDPKVTAAMKRHYSKALQWCLKQPKIVLGSVGILTIIAFCLFFTLGRSFLPGFNEGSLTINISTLPGISLEESDNIGRLAEKIILSEKEVVTVARKTGRAELDEHSQGVNVSELEVPYKLSDRTRQEFVADLRKKLSVIPGANIEIGQPISHRIDAMLSGTRAQIAIKLFGNDLNQLYSTGQAIQRVVKSVDGVVDVNIEQQVERPQIEIVPRRDMLVRYGVPMNRFSEFVDVALAGKQVSQVYENGYPAALTVKFDGQGEQDVESLRRLPIDTPEGKVPLSYLADVKSVTGPNTINRENANRRIVISANVEGGDLRGTVNEISDRIDKEVKLPQGYTLQYGGQFESEASASRTLAMTSILSFIIIFILLYLEFHDVRQSLIVLINMPLAMIGGVLILVLSGSELNIPAIIGFISLLGIATRNGMLLISHYNQLRSEGCTLDEQIAIGSVDRLTPIIMTALTSALAMIPLALRGTEPGNEIQSPMAMVILGGLFSSTALNMFVVPILYRWVSRMKSNTKKSEHNTSKDELLTEK
jgi:CzcA family heavy metal efflux pump